MGEGIWKMYDVNLQAGDTIKWKKFNNIYKEINSYQFIKVKRLRKEIMKK